MHPFMRGNGLNQRDRERDGQTDRELQRLVPPQSHRFSFTSGPTKAIQLHTKLYGSKEELEKTCRHIHLAGWTLSVAVIEKKKKTSRLKDWQNS